MNAGIMHESQGISGSGRVELMQQCAERSSAFGVSLGQSILNRQVYLSQTREIQTCQEGLTTKDAGLSSQPRALRPPLRPYKVHTNMYSKYRKEGHCLWFFSPSSRGG